MRSGFTLVELLIAIGLIAILTGLLALGVVHARDRAAAVKCLSNLHQIGNNIMETRARHPIGFYTPVVIDGRGHVLYCPAESTPNYDGYGSNSLVYRKEGVPNPSRTAQVVEEKYNPQWVDFSPALSSPAAVAAVIDVTRHGDGANYLFVDLHAEPIAWTTIQKMYNPGHNFLDPAAGW